MDEALEQNPSARRNISQSSQDNLAAIAGNTAPPPEMPVPPPFIPLGAMVGVEGRNKSSSTVTSTTQQDTPMETDASTAQELLVRPPVPTPTAAKTKVINVLIMVEEAGLTIW